jgi:hypothetical protein
VGRPGRGGEEKNSQPLPGLEPPIQTVSQCCTTELSRLLLHTVNLVYCSNTKDGNLSAAFCSVLFWSRYGEVLIHDPKVLQSIRKKHLKFV